MLPIRRQPTSVNSRTMTEIWTQAALWLGLALLATLASIWLRVATALSEIIVGTIAQLIIGAALGTTLLAGDASWLKFLAGAGALLLTFLAGAELDPAVFRRQWKQATFIGLVSFTAPFLGCAATARWLLGWSPAASWLAGLAMSTTSVAVVYAVIGSAVVPTLIANAFFLPGHLLAAGGAPGTPPP
jgi:glutathione-regulated potassium-efflux system ancillary protein KefC